MIPAEREQLIESMLAGTLDSQGRQRLEDLAQQDREVQDLLTEQDALTRGLHSDRTVALKDLEQTQLRDQVAAFSRSVAGQPAGNTMLAMMKWGAGLVVAAGLVGGAFLLNDDGGAGSGQPVPAVQMPIEIVQETDVPSAGPDIQPETEQVQAAAGESEGNVPAADRSSNVQRKSPVASSSSAAQTTESNVEGRVPAENAPESAASTQVENSGDSLKIRNNEIKGQIELELPPDR